MLRTTDDISVSASLLPYGQSEAIQSSASLTSVKVELEAVCTAPENPCASRHRYGVGEKVTFRTVPQSDSITASVHSYNASEEFLTQYNSFGGSLSAEMSAGRVYTCPVSASFSPKVAVWCGGTSYVPVMKLEDPAVVVTREARWPGGCWASGLVGEAALRTVNYIGPMHVSFQGIAVSEVPCNDVIPATGCFTQGVHNLSRAVVVRDIAYRRLCGYRFIGEQNWADFIASEIEWSAAYLLKRGKYRPKWMDELVGIPTPDWVGSGRE